MPEALKEIVSSVHQLARVDSGSLFRIFHVEMQEQGGTRGRISRGSIRRFLEFFYRHYAQGENLFVFTPLGSYDKLTFVSPRRLLDPRDAGKVRLWLRILEVDRDAPYRTDLETLFKIRVDGIHDSDKIWRRHEEAFSVQRVTEQFFQDYSGAFRRIREYLREKHGANPPDWARDYTHQLLNRIMFLYFIARKGWLLGPDGRPDRDFMRHFWEAYRESGAKDTFHSEWLPILFFEAFNNRWQNRPEYLKRFPRWLVQSFAQAPYLNGGLYTRHPGLDDRLENPVPDKYFALLFETWTDGTFPGLFERYNFTVVESGRFDEQVAVDPEMLGMVYERLVNVTFEEQEEDLRGAAGVFYTPRVEIDLMCRLGLVDWLSNQLGSDKKEFLYRWVFAFSEEEKRDADNAVTGEGLWQRLDEQMRRLRVCDPACGSGSFLVGMMLVLDDLQARCNATLGHNETPYERRKRILQDQLYGVDVMEWAVRVAELRLWLQLVVETELAPAELRFRPLLPNLDLKLRPGDSLLQTLGDLDLSPFRRSELPLPRSLKGRLTTFRGKKRRFFQGEEPGLTVDLLKHEEAQLFREILLAKIGDLDRQIKAKRLQAQTKQLSLAGMEESPEGEEKTRRLEEEIGALEEEKARYEQARDALRPDQPPPFVWDLSFVEVFEDEAPGFDIVIGNPPYVRQENIQDYLGRFERDKYLQRLNEGLRAIYPAFMGETRRISGRADYYVYFYLHSLSLLADQGTFCFITSNSWLDVDFGKDLQEFFLRHGHLKMVIDNRARRSFAQADVNTVIVLAGPPGRKRALKEEEMRERKVRFVAFRVPFEEALSPVLFSEIEDDGLYGPQAGFHILKRPEFRAVLWDQWSLWEEGLEEAEGERLVEARKYAGNKWGGKYLRAPDIFFIILEKGKGKLVRLGEIAEVRRGFTTGANEFFYLEPVELTVKEVAELREKDPQAPVSVRNSAGWEGEIEAAWLRPVIKSPREIKTLKVRLEDLRYLVFMPPEDVREAIERGDPQPWEGYPLAEDYILWGETQDYPDRPTCASRRWWWDVGEQEQYNFIMLRFRDQRNWTPLLEAGYRISDVVFVGRHYDEQYAKEFGALLNSTLHLMSTETLGRINLGEGLLTTYGPEILRFLVLHPLFLTPCQRNRLLSAFEQMASRPVKSIFEELGFPLCREPRCGHSEHPYEFVKPEKLTLEQVRTASPDRFALDEVVFDALGLTQEERLQVYQAVAQLVKERLVKARSV
jgi:hypothetical protein